MGYLLLKSFFFQMAYTISRAVKEILSGHTSYSRNTSASSSNSSSFSRIPKYFRKSKGKVKGVQFLSPRKKTADESKVEGTIESDKDEERRMACSDNLEEDISVTSGKGKVRSSRFPEESNTELRAGRKNESTTRLVECVNVDREMNPSCWISVEPENSCSRTVPVDDLCLPSGGGKGMRISYLSQALKCHLVQALADSLMQPMKDPLLLALKDHHLQVALLYLQ